ncbi:hypothetical protein C8R43DRAFT_902189 [Mycena crocata]|nr:hypothetical protein C8R43DRAFT_902189 [Mycena crocata]
MLRLEEVENVACATVSAFLRAGIRSCLVGGMACSIYGNERVPSDVDIVCLTEAHTQAELKNILIAKDPSFYTVASKDPFATYRVLYYRLGYRRSCKVDVLMPGIMNIPAVPIARIVSRRRRSDLPLMPFLPLLLLKLQAWMDHGVAEKYHLRAKQPVDVRDIDELLHVAVSKYGVNLKTDGKWLPDSFLKAAAKRVKAYAKEFPESAEHWADIGFRV